MPGKHITSQQEKLYMSLRSKGHTQRVTAAKSGMSERTGRTIEQQGPNRKKQRHWRTRQDPFKAVWSSELEPLLNNAPDLMPITLLEHLQEHYPGQYPDKLLRTLERRVKQWRAVDGKAQAVIFRQTHPSGLRGLSDFTTLKRVTITIRGTVLVHLLYHFRLACSGWSHMKVILGGESFTALAEGLQEALWRLGGAPHEHRTDSLSAAFKNLTKDEQDDCTERYAKLCAHYGMTATRNNRGAGHENGSIESSHGHIKRRIEQALLLRGHTDFDSVDAYQAWLNGVVNRHNQRNAKAVAAEKSDLLPLPCRKTTDCTEVCARVTTSATIDVRRATYTVPSQLVGENLRIHLYHDRLEGYLGSTSVITLTRKYATKDKRARQVDYRHVIDSLARKPQAFRYSQLRDDLLPNNAWHTIWQHIDSHHSSKAACRLIVGLLHLAATHNCEQALEKQVLQYIEEDKPIVLSELSRRYHQPLICVPDMPVNQHPLCSYNALMPATQHHEKAQEVQHGL